MSAPVDLPALKLAQDAHLTLGDSVNMRDCVGRVLPFWSEGETLLTRRRVYVCVVSGWVCFNSPRREHVWLLRNILPCLLVGSFWTALPSYIQLYTKQRLQSEPV